MKAVAVKNFGDQPRVMELLDPEPGPGEVLVAIEVASINPMDWKAAAGALRQMMDNELPLILGFDGAGRVQATGHGANRFAVGDLIHGQFWGDVVGRGTYAQLVAVPEQPSHGALQLVPDGVEVSLAAAVPTVGMTAEGALARTGCQPGQTLLILGATGGVGVLATQLAKHAEISVIATARRDASDQIKALGAAETIDYSEQTITDALTDVCPNGIDAVLDLTGDADQLSAIAPHLRDGATAVSIAFGVNDTLSRDRRITAVNYQLDDKPARLAHVTEALAGGQLQIPIQDEVNLDDAPAAVARCQRGGARGKTLIRI